MPINFPSNPNTNDIYTSSGTTWIYDGSAWNVVTSNTVINLPATNGFQNIAVAGQSTVTADSTTDTLNLIAGSNITITTDAGTDSITINSTASGGGASSDSFSTIAVAGQSSIVADSASDSLTVVAGSGITIETNASTDTLTITNSALPINNFNQLSDSILASLNVDQIYLPAITMLTVTNSGASAYRFDQYGTVNNPTVYAINGTTIAFKLNASGHPFLIQTGAGNNFSTGLVHVATNGAVSTGTAAQGKDSGTLYWKIPSDISGGYRYQCSIHASMVGSITIKVFATL
jgi:plastocyanin